MAKSGLQQLYTEEGRDLPKVPWEDYPRPQLARPDWLCLNGTWELAVIPRERRPARFCPVTVPFCPESLLSSVAEPPKPGETMVYRRTFTVPASWRGASGLYGPSGRILLHFGAVGREAVVFVNGREVCRHDNGCLPFTADITDALKPEEETGADAAQNFPSKAGGTDGGDGTERMASGTPQLLEVRVINDLSPAYPLGKQSRKRGGMWYTPCSGIWQTVWLEPVPEAHIVSLQIRTGLSWAEITARMSGPAASEPVLQLNGVSYPMTDGRVRVEIPDPLLWSPESPHLYPFEITAGQDRVSSYFALRTVTAETAGGVHRLCLNGRPYFFHGLLDQGYWSDGLYTPASPDGFEKDILAMKRLGFNTLRKHIKIEPERFYYDCDRLGMIVFQDMVSCGGYSYLRDTVLPTLHFQKRRDDRLHRDPAQRAHFLDAMEETARLLQPHPCVCLWTIFNEGWGQFCADGAYDRLRALDPARLINTCSGWFHQTKSDVDGRHIYFDRLHLGDEDRPQLLSEFGGFVFKIPEHSFNLKKTYGYRTYETREEMAAALREIYEEQVIPLAAQGLCGSVYTQVSDVEDETNGLLTFDRAVCKLRPEEFADIAGRLQEAVRSGQM